MLALVLVDESVGFRPSTLHEIRINKCRESRGTPPTSELDGLFACHLCVRQVPRLTEARREHG